MMEKGLSIVSLFNSAQFIVLQKHKCFVFHQENMGKRKN
jgi:hypothetical protein